MAKLKGQVLAFVCLVCGYFASGQEDTKTRENKLIQAKFGEGISFLAPDSSMYLNLTTRFQTLFIAERPLTSGAPIDKELTIRRFRIKMEGFAFTPRLEYKIELALSNQDMNGSVGKQGSNAPNIVLDAYLKYQVSKSIELLFGQGKLPGNRERVISSQALQFVDRSLVNATYNLDRDIGLQLHHQFKIGEAVVKDKYAVALGQGRNITATDSAGLSYTARVEVLPLGEFTNDGDYFDADLEREPTPKLSIGAGYSYNNDAVREGGELGAFLPASRDLKTFFADLMLKYRGWSLTSEYMDKRADESPVLMNGDGFFQTGNGWNIQSGYLFKNNIEVAGRYTMINPSDALKNAGLADKIREVTLGVSKYFLDHTLKIQSDISHTRDYLNEDPSLRFRLQVEFGF